MDARVFPLVNKGPRPTPLPDAGPPLPLRQNRCHVGARGVWCLRPRIRAQCRGAGADLMPVNVKPGADGGAATSGPCPRPPAGGPRRTAPGAVRRRRDPRRHG